MKISQFENYPFGENTYILWDDSTKHAVIIDPGMMHEQERCAMKDFVEGQHLVVEHILLTHCHVDHAASARWAAHEYGVAVWACEVDVPLAMALTEQAQRFGLKIEVRPLSIDHFIAEGDRIPLGEQEIHVLETPGHTPGGLTFYIPGMALAFTGDSIFQGSIGRTDLPGGNYAQLIDSIKTKIITLPTNTTLAPGHGPHTTVGEEKKRNPFIQ